MRNPVGITCHKCAPSDWRHTPDLTGSYELDAVIKRCPNKDMGDRLAAHLVGNDAYLVTNGYNSYSGVID